MDEKQITIANIGTGLVPSPSLAKQYRKESTAANFLPALKLLQGVSEECNTEGNAPGDYFLTVQDKNLKRKVVICIMGFRPHAMFVENGQKTMESFNEDSPVFKEIVTLAKIKHPSGTFAQWAAGEFLVYIPNTFVFAVFFPGSKTARYISFDIFDHMVEIDNRPENTKDLPYTNCFELYADMVDYKNGRKAWVPRVLPIEPLAEYFPAASAYNDAMAMFIAPIKAEAEVEEAESSDTETDR